ncbi:MAG: hypothetical protein ACRDRJ_21905 [Streptosporangiaceae bacterium]
MPDDIRDRESRAVDEIMAGRPLRLPCQLGAGESAAMYVNLGVRFLRGPSGVTVAAELPPRWGRRRIDPRWIAVHDEAGLDVIWALYKFTGYSSRAAMHLTEHGRELLRRRWEALSGWQRFFASPADWGRSRR